MPNYENIPHEMREYRQWVARFFWHDPQLGKIYWKPRDFGPSPTGYQKAWNTKFSNKEAGWITTHGYIRIRLPNNKTIYAHQLMFLLEAGYIPKEIDHKDLDKSNNKFSNLRDVTSSQNSCNVRKRKSNKAKIKGVSWSKSNNCWRMDIQYQGKKFHSYHLTKEDAYRAYCVKSEQLHREFGNVE